MNQTDTRMEELLSAMIHLDEKRVYTLVSELEALSVTSDQILDCLNQGMKEVGRLFENGDYFIADLMFSGVIYCTVLNTLLPQVKSLPGKKKSRILVGVVKNDIHDIGKDIIVSLLRADNFEVIDLGVDVPPEAFVDGIQTYHPQIISLSGMMSYSKESMKRTVEAITAAGLRNEVAILLGGGCTDKSLLHYIDADAVCQEPADTLSYCNDFTNRRFS